MFEHNVICDRCRRKCEGSTYYTIDISATDVISTDDGRVSCKTASHTMNDTLKKMHGYIRHYCENCKNAIVEFAFEDASDGVSETVDEDNSTVKNKTNNYIVNVLKRFFRRGDKND